MQVQVEAPSQRCPMAVLRRQRQPALQALPVAASSSAEAVARLWAPPQMVPSCTGGRRCWRSVHRRPRRPSTHCQCRAPCSGAATCCPSTGRTSGTGRGPRPSSGDAGGGARPRGAVAAATRMTSLDCRCPFQLSRGRRCSRGSGGGAAVAAAAGAAPRSVPFLLLVCFRVTPCFCFSAAWRVLLVFAVGLHLVTGPCSPARRVGAGIACLHGTLCPSSPVAPLPRLILPVPLLDADASALLAQPTGGTFGVISCATPHRRPAGATRLTQQYHGASIGSAVGRSARRN